MSEKELDALMARMDKIAAAVNAFNSEAVQKEAFIALLAVFNSGEAAPPTARSPRQAEEAQLLSSPEGAVEEDEAPLGNGGGKRKRAAKRATGGTAAGFKFLKELDLRPQGRQSFDEFIAEKQPASNEDKFAVAIYYLQNILELPKVTIDHVGSTFRMTKDWREPAALRTSLSVTSTRKGTITTKLDDLQMTPQGRNFVEHDLPPKPMSKAKK